MKDCIALASVVVALGVSASHAQLTDSAPHQVITVATSSGNLSASKAVLPANSEVLLNLVSKIDSRNAKFHGIFDLSVARDVMIDDRIAIPRGTPATGYISVIKGRIPHTKKQVEIELQWILIDRQYVPIRGNYRGEIHGSAWRFALMGFGALGGALSTLGTGKPKTVFAAGTEFKAFTKEPLIVAFIPSRTTDRDPSAVPPVAIDGVIATNAARSR